MPTEIRDKMKGISRRKVPPPKSWFTWLYHEVRRDRRRVWFRLKTRASTSINQTNSKLGNATFSWWISRIVTRNCATLLDFYKKGVARRSFQIKGFWIAQFTIDQGQIDLFVVATYSLNGSSELYSQPSIRLTQLVFFWSGEYSLSFVATLKVQRPRQ